MPMAEHACLNPDCSQYGQVEEEYFRDSEMKALRLMCPDCGQKMSKVLTRGPSVVWARPLSFYNDKKLEGAAEDGHWVERVRSNRNEDGSPDREYITTRQAQLKYCKEEGLVDPADLKQVDAPSDGLRSGVLK